MLIVSCKINKFRCLSQLSAMVKAIKQKSPVNVSRLLGLIKLVFGTVCGWNYRAPYTWHERRSAAFL